MAPLFGLFGIGGAGGGIGIGGIGSLISGATSLIGASIAAKGQRQAAEAQAQAYEFQAKQLEIKGKQEQAAAYWTAMREKRKKDYLISALTSKAAASGFSVDSPDVLKLGDDIIKTGTMNQQMAIASGLTQRYGLEDAANAKIADANAARQAGETMASATIIGGIGGFTKSLFSGFSDGGSYDPYYNGYR